ncbi:hypothetical protein [Chlamydiifrater phoenicopteri]|uniref:hypothetical protein n=1 Tax=Chlamydiifrater phoenicopteri TaxID=2681469 RepID=UPI001BCD6F38|nr:hypothetical protein [Chlamydiifrater phoenicopteri]
MKDPFYYESGFDIDDEQFKKILLLREAHFSGSFEEMKECYADEDFLGADPDISIEDIDYLAKIESSNETILTQALLSERDWEEIQKAKAAYEFLEDSDPESLTGKIANLILTAPFSTSLDRDAVIAEGEAIVPDIIKILDTLDLFHPLFPGFGLAPQRLIDCLGHIRSPLAIRPLFEMIGSPQTAEYDDEIASALAKIGSPAKQFLFSLLSSSPITKDHETASFCLAYFDDDEVVNFAKEQLFRPELIQFPHTIFHLANISLQTKEDPSFIEKLKRNLPKDLPSFLREEILKMIP